MFGDQHAHSKILFNVFDARTREPDALIRAVHRCRGWLAALTTWYYHQINSLNVVCFTPEWLTSAGIQQPASTMPKFIRETESIVVERLNYFCQFYHDCIESRAIQMKSIRSNWQTVWLTKVTPPRLRWGRCGRCAAGMRYMWME